jgi:hypothetical protein
LILLWYIQCVGLINRRKELKAMNDNRKNELLEQGSMLRQMEEAIERTLRNLNDGSPLKALNEQRLRDVQAERASIDRQYNELKADTHGLVAAAKRAVEIALLDVSDANLETICSEATKRAGRNQDEAKQLAFFSLRAAQDEAAAALIRVAALQSYLSGR